MKVRTPNSVSGGSALLLHSLISFFLFWVLNFFNRDTLSSILEWACEFTATSRMLTQEHKKEILIQATLITFKIHLRETNQKPNKNPVWVMCDR